MNPITRAIDTAGGQKALVELADLRSEDGTPLTPQAVNQWVMKKRKVPPRHCIKIEQATGITRYELRPDIFGPTPADPQQKAA